jgi:hypothetical protein
MLYSSCRVYREYKDNLILYQRSKLLHQVASRGRVESVTLHVLCRWIRYILRSCYTRPCMVERRMDVRGAYHALKVLDLNSGPCSSDTTSIIRPCSALSFPHLTSLESSFLYPAHQTMSLLCSANGVNHLQSREIRLRWEFLDRFN